MNPLESMKVALRALRANKMRTALTMLGVIIGVAAVILLVSIGTGVKNEVTSQIEGLGSNLLFVFPGKMGEGSSGGGGPSMATKRFVMADADAIRVRVDVATAVVPVFQSRAAVKVANKDYTSGVYAGLASGIEVFTAKLVAGRFYNRGEVDGGVKVADLGWTLAEPLGGADAVGKTITVSDQPFKVIGVFAKQGGSLGGDTDNVVYMPITTAQRLLGVSDISMVAVKLRDPADIDIARAQIARALKSKYKDEFTVFSQDQMLGILSSLLGTLTIMLAGIAGISLVVGGIGIMNIMLVSVTERTREIGIRKAVGARTQDILLQFVIEAVTLAVLGGGVGIFIGAAGAAGLSRWVPTSVTVWSVLLAFGFSAGVGIFFGVYPAWKASKLAPVEALRYE